MNQCNSLCDCFLMSKAYFLSVVAVAGGTVLALEVLAARAMAPALGSGPVTWSALLATALGSLAIGSLLGGSSGSRSEPATVIAWALLVAAGYLVVLSQFCNAALQWTAKLPLLIAEVGAAVLVQAAPLIVLGTITPVILHHGRNGTGCWAGVVLAVGSGGGIVGALAVGLLLVPAIGLTRSFLVVAAILAITAIPAIWYGRSRLAAIVLLLTLASVRVVLAAKRAGLRGRVALRTIGSADE